MLQLAEGWVFSIEGNSTMEKLVDVSGNNTISQSDTKSSPNTDVSRSLMKVHGTTGAAYREAYNSKMVSTVHNQENNLDRSATGIDGGGLGIGPSGKYDGEANEVGVGYVGNNNTHDVFGSCGGGVVNGDERFGTNSQPFHFFASPAANSYRSSEMGLSFTHAQWNELERQAVIYKHMISSVPVPHNLLFPFSRHAVDTSASSVYTLKYPRNGSDSEPGRCKRTDGKKWRCSRDVAPHQKYCERHLSRGRPRSRKHVEAKSNIVGENHKKTCLRRNSSLPKSTNDPQLPDAKNEATLNSFYNNAGTEFSILSGGGASSSYKTIHGDLGLMIGSGKHIAMNNGIEEQHLEESNVEFSNLGHSTYGPNSESLLYDQGYAEQHQLLDVFSHSNLAIQSPLGFIDAWSVDNLNRNDNANTELEQYLPSPRHRNLSPPSLTLSMAMSLGNPSSGEDMTGKSQAGNYANYCDYQQTKGCDMAWEPISRGGPLGEALQAGSIASSNPTSPYNSAPFTTVSSPSGVLHKALFLHSDNISVCNSPTSEGGFWWLN